ncbi:MAG: hypothetical protein GYB32_03870 [Algicola sp.]|nr:hypothetical protein [Algicola sp.]
MILKAFKEKSNQKFVNKLLSARRIAVDHSKMTSVGVVLNLSEFSDFEAFRAFFKSLGLQQAKTKIIAFVEDPKNANDLWDTYINPKDFGWKGKINSMDLQSFIDMPFDVLVCYYKEHHLELNLLTALSKANFKVGLYDDDRRLYDLMIDVNPKDFSLFKKELTKYLTVLNKL